MEQGVRQARRRSPSLANQAQDALIPSLTLRVLDLFLQWTRVILGNRVCAGGLCLSLAPKECPVSENVKREEGTLALAQREAGG